jgi:hypothetical protein
MFRIGNQDRQDREGNMYFTALDYVKTMVG